MQGLGVRKSVVRGLWFIVYNLIPRDFFIRHKPQATNRQLRTQQGNILVTALLILMVMNLMGLGLANLAAKQWGLATYKSVDSGVFNLTQSCSQDVIAWFGTQTGTPSSISTFTGTSTGLLTASQSSNSDISNKLAGFSYSCGVAYITSKSATSSRTSGTEIGNSGGSYSASGNQVTKDYYQITSTGTGPKNASKVINTIISVEY